MENNTSGSLWGWKGSVNQRSSPHFLLRKKGETWNTVTIDGAWTPWWQTCCRCYCYYYFQMSEIYFSVNLPEGNPQPCMKVDKMCAAASSQSLVPGTFSESQPNILSESSWGGLLPSEPLPGTSQGPQIHPFSLPSDVDCRTAIPPSYSPVCLIWPVPP